MKAKGFKGRNFIKETDYSPGEIRRILEIAGELKLQNDMGIYHDDLLRAKTLFMLFYNTSLRTRNSFEAGMTQLGGHAHFLDSKTIYTPALEGKEVAYSTERVSDVARVLDRMGNAIAIRCYGDPVEWEYGAAHALIQEFARWCDIPILNMEDDIYHPFQGLADMLTVKENFGDFNGLNFTMSWAYSPSLHKPRAVPQSAILYATMLGMNVTLAHPQGMELDPEIIKQCQTYAEDEGGSFKITDDFEEGFKGADVVYPKAWCPQVFFKPPVGEDDEKKAQKIFDTNKAWKCTSETMELANDNAIYMHCLPADRGDEVNNDVIDKTEGPGWRSVVFDEAENRLHVQKAVMSLVM